MSSFAELETDLFSAQICQEADGRFRSCVSSRVPAGRPAVRSAHLALSVPTRRNQNSFAFWQKQTYNRTAMPLAERVYSTRHSPRALVALALYCTFCPRAQGLGQLVKSIFTLYPYHWNHPLCTMVSLSKTDFKIPAEEL